jgi:hypothetical protein
MYYACTEDVSCMVEKANSMIVDLFNKKPSDESISCHPKQIAGIDLDGLAYFEGLMENGCITSNLYILEKDYEEAYQSHGELDERIFISGEVSLMGCVSCDSPDISAYKVQTLPQFSFPPDLLSCDEDFCDNPITLPVMHRCQVSCHVVVQSLIDFD